MNTLERKLILIIVPVMLLLVIGYIAIAQQENTTSSQDNEKSHIMLTPDNLNWTEGPDFLPAGAQLVVMEGDPTKVGSFTMRLRFPAAYRIPPHSHPIDEHITVLSGTFIMGMGDKFETQGVSSLPAGSYAMMPAKTNHFAWVTEETIVQLHGVGPFEINYVNPDDDPRNASSKK